jgi:tRNA uridine 5-carboxymethylaminomethyl modification enzyme
VVETWVQRLEVARTQGATFGERIRRGDVNTLPPELASEKDVIREEVLYRAKYQGYLQREQKHVLKLNQLEQMRIPAGLDYSGIRGLRRESAFKLAEIRPMTLGQASRISGVNPADISILMVRLEAGRREQSPQSGAAHGS